MSTLLCKFYIEFISALFLLKAHSQEIKLLLNPEFSRPLVHTHNFFISFIMLVVCISDISLAIFKPRDCATFG